MPPAFPLNQAEVSDFVDRALEEDIGSGDITAESVIVADAALTAVIAAREDMVLAGLPLAAALVRQLDPQCNFAAKAEDGAPVKAGAVMAELSGNARALLTAERGALNALQHLSGIATNVARYVAQIEGTGASLLDTRKTIPGWRKLAKYAAACGGAKNHRMGLFDAVMIKDNHIAVAGSIGAAVAAAKAAGHRDIQVECDTLTQVDEALAAGATSLLLDNMGPEKLRQAVARVDGRVPLEASGGITLDNIRAIAATGVDYISVGTALTLSAPAVDIGMDFRA